ncbi:MAG: LysM peptidoglycan-binding domain-containing protein [Treponema sp.]|jgi:membrane-bound lytic murein transglycosylase D|nr:LysM peptidoglycan-binding domain-containing protein [Treponema sp.]
MAKNFKFSVPSALLLACTLLLVCGLWLVAVPWPGAAEDPDASPVNADIAMSPVKSASLPEGIALNGRPLRRQVFSPPERFVRPAQVPQEAVPDTSAEQNPKAGPIPGIDQDLTRQYLTRYSEAPSLAWLRSVMERAGPYLSFIREEIKSRNLPPELLYLPVIESGYVPTAISKSGAAGLWQFMRNSIAPFDMRVDDWVDERMDFWKSTQGALQKLEENYEILGDWPLALAAYNTGLGGLNQIMRQTGCRDYWELARRKALRTETIHYVPKLLAVARILSEPRKYGLGNWQESLEWTRVPLNKTVDLNLLARETGIDPAVLSRGNKELLLGISPPVQGYLLKVPVEHAALVETALAGSADMIRHYYHMIRSGDTLSTLALRYGVTVALIERANPGIKSRALQIGSHLKIPAVKAAPAGERRPVENFGGNYVVQRGDTLWSIALKYGADIVNLARANDLNINGILREGKNLKVPVR